MSTDRQKTFLFLQGPHGPFFHRLGKMLRAAGAEVWRVGFNAGEAAGQTVMHLHVHVIPRWAGDTMSVPNWPKPTAAPDELAAMARRLGA